MKKTISRALSIMLAVALLAGTSLSSFAAMGADVGGPTKPTHKNSGRIHYADGTKLSGDSYDMAERDSLRPYFESLNMSAVDINDLSCGGVIPMEVGQSIVIHTLQNDYALGGKPHNIYFKNADNMFEATSGTMIEEASQSGNSTFCLPFTLTAKKEGTVIFVYQTNPYPFSYYKVVIGSGVSAPVEEAPAAPSQPAAPPIPDDAPAPAPIPNDAPAAVTGGSTHIVSAGDTFAKLALNYYGDMGYWPQLYAANAAAVEQAANKRIYKGMPLVLPANIGNGLIAPAVAGAGESLYTVKAGDSYGKIAQAHLGSASRYQEIFNRNTDRLKDIKTLFEGQVLVLPAK